VPEDAAAPETAPAFNPAPGVCKPLDCGAPVAPATDSNIVLGTTPKTTTLGAEVSVECKPGYQLAAKSASKLTCAAKEDAAEALVAWQGSPVCEKKTCELPKVENGKIECSSAGQGAKFEEACALSCDEGFEVSGKKEMICGADGAFAGNGKCVEKKSACALPVLAEKMVSVDCGSHDADEKKEDHVANGAECAVTCEAGYSATGPFVCNEGVFATPTPVCVETGSEVVQTSYVTGSLALSLSALPEGKTLADLSEDTEFKKAVSVSVAAGLSTVEPEAVEVTKITAASARRALRALAEEQQKEAPVSLVIEYRIKVADAKAAAALKETLSTKKEDFAKTFSSKLAEEYAGVKVASVEVKEPSVLLETEVIPPEKETKPKETTGGSNTAVVAGLIGAICGIILLGGLFLYSKGGSTPKEQPPMAPSTSSAADLEQPPAVSAAPAPVTSTSDVLLQAQAEQVAVEKPDGKVLI